MRPPPHAPSPHSFTRNDAPNDAPLSRRPPASPPRATPPPRARTFSTAGVEADTWTYTSLLNTNVAQGDVEGATLVMQRMKEAGVEANTVTVSLWTSLCAAPLP
jgi:pentatricopeptide repeat protein